MADVGKLQQNFNISGGWKELTDSNSGTRQMFPGLGIILKGDLSTSGESRSGLRV